MQTNYSNIRFKPLKGHAINSDREQSIQKDIMAESGEGRRHIKNN